MISHDLNLREALPIASTGQKQRGLPFLNIVTSPWQSIEGKRSQEPEWIVIAVSGPAIADHLPVSTQMYADALTRGRIHRGPTSFFAYLRVVSGRRRPEHVTTRLIALGEHTIWFDGLASLPSWIGGMDQGPRREWGTRQPCNSTSVFNKKFWFLNRGDFDRRVEYPR